MRQIIGFLLVGGFIVACIYGAGRNSEQRVLDATVRMERMAVALEHTKIMSREMKDEIIRLVHQSWSDCDQIACRQWLELRNRQARTRLQAALAGAKAPAGYQAQVARTAHYNLW